MYEQGKAKNCPALVIQNYFYKIHSFKIDFFKLISFKHTVNIQVLMHYIELYLLVGVFLLT